MKCLYLHRQTNHDTSNMEQMYVITGVNRLTGQREELSRGMPKEQAQERLEREQLSRRRQKYLPHVRLRVERRLPVQLTIQFKDDE